MGHDAGIIKKHCWRIT